MADNKACQAKYFCVAGLPEVWGMEMDVDMDMNMDMVRFFCIPLFNNSSCPLQRDVWLSWLQVSVFWTCLLGYRKQADECFLPE